MEPDGVTTFAASSPKVVFVDNADLKKFGLFPNPAVKYLTIQLPDFGKSTVKLFNNMGHLVREEKFSDRNFVLDLQTLTRGIYNVQVIQNGLNYTRKFVKN